MQICPKDKLCFEPVEAQAVHNHRRGMWREAVSPSPAAAEHSIGNIFLFQGFNCAKSGIIPSPGLYLRLCRHYLFTDFSRVCWTDLDKLYLCQGIISSTCPQHSAPPEQACALQQLRQGKLLPHGVAGQFSCLWEVTTKMQKGQTQNKDMFAPFHAPCCEGRSLLPSLGTGKKQERMDVAENSPG